MCQWLFLIAFIFISFFSSYAQKDSVMYELGKTYFRTHCAMCHSAHQEIYGPMLGSISKKKPESWLIAFIQNSQEVIKSGDPYANALFKKFNNQEMPSFEKLSDNDIKSILHYLEYESLYPSEYINDTDISSVTNTSIIQGKQEFLDHCAACHYIHKESNFAPALGSVTKRHSREWITSFIHNSQGVIKGGDAYAENLFQQFDRHVMTSMDFLSADEINSILDYIEFASTTDASYSGKINKAVYKKQAIKTVQQFSNIPSFFTGMCIALISTGLSSLLLLLYYISIFKQKLTA